MATHNGERYLAEQLESLAGQTCPPCRLAVHDDCSTDGTVNIVEDFRSTASFPVSLVRSSSRQGHASCFLSAADHCRTDLIAFCDQDDIWLPHKLARCREEFARSRDVLLVVHSAAIVDASMQVRLGHFPAYRRRHATTPTSTVLSPQTPGFATLLDRRVLEVGRAVGAIPGYVDTLGHDDWLPFLAAAFGGVVFLPDRLVFYRQHKNNQWGAPPSRVGALLRGSAPYQGREEVLHRESAAWAREFASQLERLHRRAHDLPLDLPFPDARPRARRWRRLALVSDRRAEVYAAKSSRRSLRALLLHAIRNDYGRRSRGGLGAASFGRDLLHASGFLKIASHSIATRSTLVVARFRSRRLPTATWARGRTGQPPTRPEDPRQMFPS